MYKSEIEMNNHFDELQREFDAEDAAQAERERVAAAERKFAMHPDTEASPEAWMKFAHPEDEVVAERSKVARDLTSILIDPPEEAFFVSDPLLSPARPQVA